MPLIMNGVIIPENVANALYFNGVSITDMFMNGVQVFNQSLFSATWSGNSLDNNGDGIVSSGSLFKWTDGTNSGSWLTTNSNGTFTAGVSSVTFVVSQVGLKTTGNNQIRPYYYYNNVESAVTGVATYTIGVGFTGGGYATTNNMPTIETSGGLIRVKQSNVATFGAWVSLA